MVFLAGFRLAGARGVDGAGARLGAAGLALTCVVLAGCGTPAPQGAEQYDLRAAQRQAVAAARAGTPAPAAPAPGAIAARELSAAGIPVDTGGSATVAMTTPAALPAATDAGQTSGAVGLSDEQDFDAVSARESIESDKERLAAQRAAYQQIAPEALPERPASTNTAIIDFALSTTNAVGERVWPRSGKTSQDRFYSACARYPSQDVAQAEFLKAGGPQSDRRGVDPDGDGFACFWDPTPFRLAREGAVAAPVAREVLPGEAEPGTVGMGGTMVRTSDLDQTPLN